MFAQTPFGQCGALSQHASYDKCNSHHDEIQLVPQLGPNKRCIVDMITPSLMSLHSLQVSMVNDPVVVTSAPASIVAPLGLRLRRNTTSLPAVANAGCPLPHILNFLIISPRRLKRLSFRLFHIWLVSSDGDRRSETKWQPHQAKVIVHFEGF